MSKKTNSFRVGKVLAYLRSRVWYLCYYENGQRHRPRVGPDRQAARELAAQVEVGAPIVDLIPLRLDGSGSRRAGSVTGGLSRCVKKLALLAPLAPLRGRARIGLQRHRLLSPDGTGLP